MDMRSGMATGQAACIRSTQDLATVSASLEQILRLRSLTLAPRRMTEKGRRRQEDG